MERLVIMENGEEHTYNITSRVITIGRSSKNDVPVKDRNASRRHCNILKIADSWFVVDCDSQNGTFVNGEKIKKRELEDGDKISISSTEILFLIAANKDEIPEAQESQPKAAMSPSPSVSTSTPQEAKDEQPDAGNPEEDDKNETSESGLLAQAGFTKDEKKTERATRPSEEIAMEVKPKESAPEEPASVNKEPPRATARQPILTNPQNIRWVKKCYEQLQKQLVPDFIEQDATVKMLFLALISGGHCLLQGNSLVHQQVLLHKMAKCLGLSCQFVFLQQHSQLPSVSSEYDVIVIANVTEHYAQLASFLMDQNLAPLHFQGNKANKVPMIVVCDPAANLNSIPLALRNAFMFILELPQPTLVQETAILGYWQKQSERPAPMITGKDDIYSFRHIVDSIRIPYGLQEYIAKLVCGARPEHPQAVTCVRTNLKAGPDSFSSILIQHASQAYSAFHSHEEVTKTDIQAIAGLILPPKFILNPATPATPAASPATPPATPEAPVATPETPTASPVSPAQIFQNLLTELEPKESNETGSIKA